VRYVHHDLQFVTESTQEAKVCKRWCSIIDTSVAIELLIGFAIDGRKLPNIHRPNLPYNETLEQLYRSNAAWEALTPTFSLDFRIPGKRLTYEVADGLFVNGTSENPTESTDETRAIEFWELPDGVLSTEMRNVVNHPDLGVNIVDFSFDRGQDLLIYIEMKYSFIGPSQIMTSLNYSLEANSLEGKINTSFTCGPFQLMGFTQRPRRVE